VRRRLRHSRRLDRDAGVRSEQRGQAAVAQAEGGGGFAPGGLVRLDGHAAEGGEQAVPQGRELFRAQGLLRLDRPLARVAEGGLARKVRPPAEARREAHREAEEVQDAAARGLPFAGLTQSARPALHLVGMPEEARGYPRRAMAWDDLGG